MKRLIVLVLLLLGASSARAVTCHVVGPVALGGGGGTDFTNPMAQPSSTAWIRGDIYYLISGTMPSKIIVGTAVSGTTLITITHPTLADHGQACTPSIANGYNDTSMSGRTILPLVEILTSYVVIDGAYHPTLWQQDGGGMNVTSGYGFYVPGSACGGTGSVPCWEINVSNGLGNTNVTVKNLGILGHGDSATDTGVQDTPIRAVGGGGNYLFQYIGIYNSSLGCAQLWNVDNWVWDHIWCEHTHATGPNHSEPISMSGGSHNVISDSVFKDVEGTGGLVQLSVGGVGQVADDYLIYGNIFFLQPGNPTGRSAWGNGVLSCINNDSWTNVKFVNNTIANLIGSTRIYMPTGAGNCASSTGLIVKNNLWFNNGNGTLDVSPFVDAAQCSGFNYNSYLKNTVSSCDLGANTIVNGSAPNPFVNTSQILPTDYYLASNTNVTPWLNTNATVPGNATDMIATTRALSRGTFERAGATAPALTLSPSPLAFGSQNVSTTSAPRTITVTNSGTAPEILGSLYFTLGGTNPGDFANAGGSCANGGTIAVGVSCTSIYTCTPLANGPRAATVTINGTASASDSLTCTGNPPPIPVVTLNPKVQNLGTVNTGASSANFPFTLTNTGTANLSITSITSTDATHFPLNSNTCGVTLIPAASCGWNATFAPAVAGAQTATINVVTDASTSPDTIALSGTGFTPVINPPPAPTPQIFTSNPAPGVIDVVVNNCANPCKIEVKCLGGCKWNAKLVAILD